MPNKFKSLIRTVQLQDAVGGRASPHFDRESKHLTGPAATKPKQRIKEKSSQSTTTFIIPIRDEKFF
jgi:hypothetical protein